VLAFRPIDPNQTADVEAIARWSNDDTIRHLFRRFRDAADYQIAIEPGPLRRRLHKILDEGKLVHLIELDGEVVGEVSCEIDGPHLHAPVPGSAWIGVVIGESRARGCGVGRLAMQHVEDQARERGAHRAEIGVFEFNERARSLYARIGYQEFARIDEFTWWKGRRWTDIRMAKPL